MKCQEAPLGKSDECKQNGECGKNDKSDKKSPKDWQKLKIQITSHTTRSLRNKTPKVVPVGCIGLWKHNGFLSEFGKIREIGKMCHVISIDE